MRRIAAIALLLIAAGLIVALPATGDDDGPYRVRAIFDNGAFLVNGEEVRIAGARVGTVESVDVSGEDEIVTEDGEPSPGKAVVVMRIDEPGFRSFLADASCTIRPQSLIGEKFVDCKPTQPRAPGSPAPAELERIPEGEPGEGQYLLPLERNSTSVDIDLVNNIMRLPYRERFRIIINELGAGLAARGEDLAEVVERANPGLRELNQVLKILADQRDQLAAIASDGDTALAPLARERAAITGFISNANAAAEATAERGEDLEANFERFPEGLRQLRQTMVKLDRLASEGTPVFRDLGVAAPSINTATIKLAPFARLGIPALRSLGNAADGSVDQFVAADPVVVDLRRLGERANPLARNLMRVLTTMEQTNGFRHLMNFIRNSATAINSYDQYGHFLRTNVLVSPCVQYRPPGRPSGACSANFTDTLAGASAAPASVESLLRGQGAFGVEDEDEDLPEESTTTVPELEPTTPDPEADPEASGGEPTAEGARVRRGRRGAAISELEAAGLLLSFLLEDGS